MVALFCKLVVSVVAEEETDAGVDSVDTVVLEVIFGVFVRD